MTEPTTYINQIQVKAAQGNNQETVNIKDTLCGGMDSSRWLKTPVEAGIFQNKTPDLLQPGSRVSLGDKNGPNSCTTSDKACKAGECCMTLESSITNVKLTTKNNKTTLSWDYNNVVGTTAPWKVGASTECDKKRTDQTKFRAKDGDGSFNSCDECVKIIQPSWCICGQTLVGDTIIYYPTNEADCSKLIIDDSKNQISLDITEFLNGGKNNDYYIASIFICANTSYSLSGVFDNILDYNNKTQNTTTLNGSNYNMCSALPNGQLAPITGDQALYYKVEPNKGSNGKDIPAVPNGKYIQLVGRNEMNSVGMEALKYKDGKVTNGKGSWPSIWRFDSRNITYRINENISKGEIVIKNICANVTFGSYAKFANESYKKGMFAWTPSVVPNTIHYDYTTNNNNAMVPEGDKGNNSILESLITDSSNLKTSHAAFSYVDDKPDNELYTVSMGDDNDRINAYMSLKKQTQDNGNVSLFCCKLVLITVDSDKGVFYTGKNTYAPWTKGDPFPYTNKKAIVGFLTGNKKFNTLKMQIKNSNVTPKISKPSILCININYITVTSSKWDKTTFGGKYVTLPFLYDPGNPKNGATQYQSVNFGNKYIIRYNDKDNNWELQSLEYTVDVNKQTTWTTIKEGSGPPSKYTVIAKTTTTRSPIVPVSYVKTTNGKHYSCNVWGDKGDDAVVRLCSFPHDG